MEIFLIKFMTNYEEAALIITTDKGIKYAKSRAEYLGAWEGYTIQKINIKNEGEFCSVNFGHNYSGILNEKGEIKK